MSLIKHDVAEALRAADATAMYFLTALVLLLYAQHYGNALSD